MAINTEILFHVDKYKKAVDVVCQQPEKGL